MTKDDKERVVRRVHPTVAFTITVSQNKWIAQQAKENRLSKSEFLRNLIDRQMTGEKPGVAA